MLEDAAIGGHEDIVSWQPHGKAFRVHKPQEFTKYILPCYFKQTKYKSFQRQLHIYGFQRISRKELPDWGAYYHDKFLRHDKELCLTMSRQKIKGSPSVACTPDPNFYAQLTGTGASTGKTSAPRPTRTVSLDDCSPMAEESL